MRTIYLVLLALSLLLGLQACSLFGDGNIRPTEELASPDKTERTFVAKPGDVLAVKVWGEPRVSGDVFVRDDGKFTLPLIDEVTAEGKTLAQIRKTIGSKLKEFIPAAQVSVTVVQAAPVKYFLAGQFLKPGEYRSDGRITLLQSIATAGGFAPFADESRLTLIRKGSQGELRYQLDYNRVVDGREPNPELKSGDFISVK